MDKNNIVLIGFMGSGKSSVGHNLAYILEKKFIDTDTFIEKATGVSIPDMFMNQGEGYFRAREKEAIAEVAQKQKVIIATGGGAVLDKENVKVLGSTGCIVYLKATIDHLYNNLKLDQSRPLLQEDNMLETIKNLMDHREQIYEDAADMVVDVSGKKIPEIVREIKEKLRMN